MQRRVFLSQSLSAVALAGLSARGLRADESPSQKITLGIMGLNGRGNELARSFVAIPGVEIAYLCDVDERAIGKNMKAFEDLQSKKPEGVRNFRKILDDQSIDCLVVAAPDHWHGPATILGCSAGKHVYVEKPACHNPHEGELMVEAARKNKRVVQMGNQRRSSPDLQAAIKRVQAGELGRVLLARGWINSTRPNIGYGKPAPVPEYLDYTLWQGPAPDVEYRDNIIHYNWHWFWHWGTGELGNNGIHALDVCRWGLDADYPKTVTCGGGKFHFDDDQQTPDTQIVTYNFGDRAINWEHRTWNKRGFEGETFGIIFYGEKQNMVITRNITIYDMNGKEVEKLPVKTGDKEHFTNFLNCVRSGERPNSDIEEGVKSTLLCHLGNIAYRTGQTVNFDPQQKKIVDNPDQQKLWSRQYRPGWEPKV
jgi:predicted dehydrogenase